VTFMRVHTHWLECDSAAWTFLIVGIAADLLPARAALISPANSASLCARAASLSLLCFLSLSK
jgi:hypothetical protein